MNLFTWKKDFESGIPMLDEEHKELFISFNIFIIRSRVSVNHTLASLFVQQFRNMAEAHYERELSYMTTMEYPNIKEHKAMHLGIVFSSKQLAVEVASSELDQDSIEKVYHFIRDTAYTHFIEEDLNFVRFYKGRQNE